MMVKSMALLDKPQDEKKRKFKMTRVRGTRGEEYNSKKKMMD